MSDVDTPECADVGSIATNADASEVFYREDLAHGLSPD
jgi:hypothetical protein